MDYARIEEEANRLQRELWKHRVALLGRDPVDPLDVLDPEVAARMLGFVYEALPELGRFGDRRGKFEVAGMIDRPRNRIAVARKFGPQVQRFTGGHELAHMLFHPREVMHRDRPIKGLAEAREPRDPMEREADRFAACFLIPSKMLRKVFRRNFGVAEGFQFDDAAAFFLSPGDPEALLFSNATSLDRALSLATAHSFGGRRITKLVDLFKVSPASMAIRIEELGLIRH